MLPQSFGAFAIVADAASRVLLCHRTDMDAWNLPGGGSESHETPRQTVVREVHEETGLRVAVTRRVGRYRVPGQNVIVHTFICKQIGGRVRTGAEADRIAWFAYRTLPRSTLARHAERIAHALLSDSRVVRRTQ